MAQQLKFKGKLYPTLSVNDLTMDEVDALERAIDMTYAEVMRKAQTCVCGHGDKRHDDKSSACAQCSCEGFEPNIPSRVGSGVMWLAIRRRSPRIEFSDVQAAKSADFEFVGTPDVPTGADEATTSE